MSTVAIIQARTGSTRLPGKVLLDLAGEPMLARVVERVRRATTVDRVVVATTTLTADDALEDLARSRGWSLFRGEEHDVLDRYYRAAVAYKAEVVVRITSDCPLIDPGLIDSTVRALGRHDYAINTGYPRGLVAEVFPFAALAAAWQEDRNPAWREHVTPFIYRHPERFSLHEVPNEVDLSALRWTVDTPEDLALARMFYDHFRSDGFDWRAAHALFLAHPTWSALNQDVQQKTVPDGPAAPSGPAERSPS